MHDHTLILDEYILLPSINTSGHCSIAFFISYSTFHHEPSGTLFYLLIFSANYIKLSPQYTFMLFFQFKIFKSMHRIGCLNSFPCFELFMYSHHPTPEGYPLYFTLFTNYRCCLPFLNLSIYFYLFRTYTHFVLCGCLYNVGLKVHSYS